MAVLSDAFSVPLGTALPAVTLPDLAGDMVSIRDLVDGRPLLVFFGCNHCPYVRHVEVSLGELLASHREDVAVVAISSNDVEQYPDDDVEGLASQRERADWRFPYLVDSDQTAAKAFRAACTPDFYLYDRTGHLAYRGAFDASTPKNGEPLTGELLATALERVIADEAVPQPHRPALGCGIKWKPGNEPEELR